MLPTRINLLHHFSYYRLSLFWFPFLSHVLPLSGYPTIFPFAFATSFESESIEFCPICHRSALTVTSKTRPSLQLAFKNLVKCCSLIIDAWKSLPTFEYALRFLLCTDGRWEVFSDLMLLLIIFYLNTGTSLVVLADLDNVASSIALPGR